MKRCLQTLSCSSLVPWVKKCFPPDLNPRPRSRSRPRWFILDPTSPRSEDTAIRVFQDPVPADDDLSPPRSGSILPSLLSNLTHTSGEGSGSSGQGLRCYTVSTGVTVTCACAASRLRFSTRHLSMANTSYLLFNPTANMSSTCTTAMIATRPSSTKRKTHASAKHC